MPYVLVALFFVVLAVILALTGLRSTSASSPPESEPPLANWTIDGKKESKLTHEEVKQQLEELAESEPPSELAVGAMCYEAVSPPDRVEYICPKCDEKTLYALDDEENRDYWSIINTVQENIPVCRRVLEHIDSVDMTLFESEFCEKCKPDVEQPRLGLVVRYPSSVEPHRVWGVSANDCVLLDEFFSGKDKHTYSNDGEDPLKNHVERLSELLGVELDK